MNVLIVDDDKNFGRAISKKLKQDKSISNIKFYNNIDNTFDTLHENIDSYSLGIINLDSIHHSNFYYDEKIPYIVYSANNKTLNKYINNPAVQRAFHKPFSLSCFFKYLSSYCGILKDEPQKEEKTIDKLTKIGFSRSWIGTTYLAESIDIAISRTSKNYKSNIC